MGKWGDQVIMRERKRQLLSAAAPVISYSPSQDPPTWVHLQVMVRVQVDPLVGLIRGTQIVVNRTQVVVQMQVDPLGQCIQLESTASRGGQLDSGGGAGPKRPIGGLHHDKGTSVLLP